MKAFRVGLILATVGGGFALDVSADLNGSYKQIDFDGDLAESAGNAGHPWTPLDTAAHLCERRPPARGRPCPMLSSQSAKSPSC